MNSSSLLHDEPNSLTSIPLLLSEVKRLRRMGRCIAQLKELGQEHPRYCSANKVGNMFEWLVWAAFEEQRYDFIASLTTHAVAGPRGQAFVV